MNTGVTTSRTAAMTMPPTTLSYADRAKKAQNIRSPIENSVHAVSVSMSASISSNSSSILSSSASSSSSIVGSSTVTSSNSTDVDVTDFTAPTTSSSSVIVDSDGEGSGQKSLARKQQQEKERQKETDGIQSVAQKPKVNVWQLRMAGAKVPREQGIKGDQASSKVSTAPAPTPAAPSSSLASSSTLESSAKPSPTSPMTGITSAIPSTSTSVPLPRMNSVNGKDIERDDPFVVKVRPSTNNWGSRPALVSPSWPNGTNGSSKSVPLDLRDLDIWPEVGVGLGSSNNGKGKGRSNGEEEEEEEQGVLGEQKETENLTSNTPKSNKVKSKSKWVAIPAVELQAAADAAAVARRQQARNLANSTSNPNPTPDSRSRSQSQQRSRNQSQRSSRDTSLSRPLPNGAGKASRNTGASGGRPSSRSGTTSISQSPHQSRVHSRAASVHASPLSRDVRLPAEGAARLPISFDWNQRNDHTLLPFNNSSAALEFESSTLPSVFPVQIQQQHQQQHKEQQYHSQSLLCDAPGTLAAHLPNGHHTPNSRPDSHPASPPPPPSQVPIPSSININPSSPHSTPMSPPLPYTSPYPYYGSPYEMPPHPGIVHSNPVFWQSLASSPSGSGHQTPNYIGQPGSRPFVVPSNEYGFHPSMYGPSYTPSYMQDVRKPYVSAGMVAPSLSRRSSVVFGSFAEEQERERASPVPRPPFSIGLGPGHAGPSRPKKAAKDVRKKRGSKRKTSGVMMLGDHAEVIDLTDRHDSAEESQGMGNGVMKWRFGTFVGDDVNDESKQQDAPRTLDAQSPHLVPTPPHPSLPPAYIPVGSVPIPVPVPAPVPPISLSTLAGLPPIHTHFPNPIPPHPSLSGVGPYSAETGPSTSPIPPPNDRDRGDSETFAGGSYAGESNHQTPVGVGENEWEVRDFGYGFGRDARGAGYRAEDPAGSPNDAYTNPNFSSNGGFYPGARPRRESFSYNNPYAGYGERGSYGEQRGGYGGYAPRRGRGFGRGLRGFRRGVYGGYGYDRYRERDTYSSSSSSRGRGSGPPNPHAASFALTPPPEFQPLPMPPTQMDYGLQTYIPLPPAIEKQYHSPSGGIDSLQGNAGAPPVPPPISRLSFELHPTAYYLLGQLEYYLSPQNMAQDFYLRQKMDSHGWVPISLIASFNRVRQLTMDEAFVREVLSLSTVAEVGGDMVRMREGAWEQYVLPGAQDSMVDNPVGRDMGRDMDMSMGLDMRDFTSTPARTTAESAKMRSLVEEAVLRNVPAHGGGGGGGDVEAEEEEMEDDDDEDVVFVMGQESGVWSPGIESRS